MKFFIDTANISEIKRLKAMGLVDGITTNPSIIAKNGRPFQEVITDICQIVAGPVSAEVVATTRLGMLSEAHEMVKWAPNVVVKVPMTEVGLVAVHELKKVGIKTNVTLIFTMAQGLLAMKAGASFISPFLGRLDDIGTPSLELIENLRWLIDLYGFESEIIAASIRHLPHVEEVALRGAHIATIPDSLFDTLVSHPLTDRGLEVFLQDWEMFQNED